MTENTLKEILVSLPTPLAGKTISLEAFEVQKKEVKFRLVIPGLDVQLKQAIKLQIENKLKELGFDSFFSIVEKSLSGLSRNSTTQPPKKENTGLISEGIFTYFKHIIAVHSAKGGVGKSTISVGLAQAFAAQGLRTIIIDLDIYGPSVPRILGTQKEVELYDQQFVPLEKNGIHMLSVGNLITDKTTPLIWRAPIANGLVKQLFEDTHWDRTYDICILDMPPGTGDVPITVAQNIPLEGVVAVATPQALALEDTVKGIAMFRKMEVPVFGLIKNMSCLVCSDCKKEIPLYPHTKEFDHFLKENKVVLLGDLALDIEVSHLADEGNLHTLSTDSSWRGNMTQIASRIYDQIQAKMQ